MTGATQGFRQRADFRGQAGISLVEALIALLLLSIIMMALASTAMASLRSVSLSEARQQSYTEATLVLERVRDLDFSDLKLAEDTTASSIPFDWFDPAVGTFTNPGSVEQVERFDNAGDISQLEAAPFQQNSPNAIRTVVTRPDPDNPQQVRVTVLAELGPGGTTEIVRQSTLVNSGLRVQWGLEQPQFSAAPVFGSLSTQRPATDPSLNGPPGADCVDRVDHTIKNQGQKDRYQIITPTLAEAPGLGSFDVSVYEIPPSGTPVLRPSGSFTGEYEANESFVFRVCYRPNASASSLTDAPFTIRSELAETLHAGDADTLGQLRQQVLHSVAIETGRTRYLVGSGNEPRDPLIPYVTSPDPPPIPMPNHDTNADALPGLALPNLADGGLEQTALWRHGFQARRTITTPLQVRLWTSSPQAAAAPAGTPTEVETARIVLQVRKIAADGSPLEIVHASTRDLSHASGGWTERLWNLDMVQSVWNPGEQLQLAVQCAPSSSAPCLLGFGGQDFPASVRMVFP